MSESTYGSSAAPSHPGSCQSLGQPPFARRHDAALARRLSCYSHQFFPSFALTLNHILAVDLYYVGALYRGADLKRKSREFQSCDTVAELALRQAASDMRLITFCNALNAEGADAMIDMDRGTYVQKERAGHVLAHLFMHQTHHRGQAHAMLSGTGIKPPQLDEFPMPSEAEFRVGDMAVLGWEEREIYRER